VPWRPYPLGLDDPAGRFAHRPPRADGTTWWSGAVYGTLGRPLSLLTRSWAAEDGPRGVNINELAPGPVRTTGTDAMGEGFEGHRRRARQAAAPDEIAAAAVYLSSEYGD
jgi:NAD(P)-dependent dehydrogenase (short-subunit alcohol dehydrogenase family)